MGGNLIFVYWLIKSVLFFFWGGLGLLTISFSDVYRNSIARSSRLGDLGLGTWGPFWFALPFLRLARIFWH